MWGDIRYQVLDEKRGLTSEADTFECYNMSLIVASQIWRLDTESCFNETVIRHPDSTRTMMMMITYLQVVRLK